MRRAMVAGAHDFLTKPPVIDELITAIRRGGNVAHEERAKMASSSLAHAGHAGSSSTLLTSKNGKVIVVYSPKGGTGTTTIATNLAICLHSEETKTALVDASLQFGDVAVFLNEQGKNTIFDLTSRADELDPEIVEEVMITHPASGVHVLAAPSKPELAENVDGNQFSKVLHFLRQLYSYIVIDTSSYLNDVVLAALDVADLVIVITTQEIPAVKNVKLFLSLLDAMQIERRRIIFAMNRYDKRIALLPEKIGESLKQNIAAVIPLDERTVIPSVNRGIPFIMDNKTQPIGKSILSLAELVREVVIKPEEDVLEKVTKR
jgi:pilus assembly protein CpaE